MGPGAVPRKSSAWHDCQAAQLGLASQIRHPILLLETFVDRRFQGICYRAANWLRLGQTTGRTRNGGNTPVKAQIKDVYIYALHKQAIQRLRDE